MGERKIAKLVHNDEVEPCDKLGKTPLLTITRFRFKTIDEIDDVVEAPARAVADQGTGKCDGQMGFSSASSSNEDDIVLLGKESSARELAQQPDLRVHLDASDRIVNLVDEGFDVAIRFGAMSDSSLIARTVAPNAYVMCADQPISIVEVGPARSTTCCRMSAFYSARHPTTAGRSRTAPRSKFVVISQQMTEISRMPGRWKELA